MVDWACLMRISLQWASHATPLLLLTCSLTVFPQQISESKADQTLDHGLALSSSPVMFPLTQRLQYYTNPKTSRPPLLPALPICLLPSASPSVPLPHPARIPLMPLFVMDHPKQVLFLRPLPTFSLLPPIPYKNNSPSFSKYSNYFLYFTSYISPVC